MTADVAHAPDHQPKAKIFISYSRKDLAFADRVEAALKERGFEILIDRQEIYAFEDWWKRIEGLLGKADTVVFVLSPDAVSSEVCAKEVAHAASLNKRFAPIVARRVNAGAVPEVLRQLNFIFFDDPAGFEASADRLAEALQTDIAWIRRHTEFGEAARRWIEGGRSGGLLLRPPVLDQAEAWVAFRPGSAPSPTAETEAFIAASQKAEVAARRRSRILNAALYTMLISIILGLVGWINQSYIVDQWHWWAVTRPYAAAQVWPHVLTAAQEQALKPGDSFKECTKDCADMIVVPAGSFTMGSPPTEKDRFGPEGPQHVVTFARPFAVAKYEVTFADWDACVIGGGCSGYRPNGRAGGQDPVINVNSDDAHQYAAWFSLVTGKTYRLLSESEYEYATRAGTTTPYPWGDDIKLNGVAMADCNGCGSKWDFQRTAPVGSFPPNKFGLYDMVGNVWEWAEDCVHTTYTGAPVDGSAWMKSNGADCNRRVWRAGAWLNIPSDLRSARRNGSNYGTRTGYTGFRVARTLIAP